MQTLRDQLETRLQDLPDIDVRLYKDTDLMCVYYKGKEFAHFHDHQEIDIRMSTKFARAQELGPPLVSARHPDRSKNSRWRSFQFKNEQDVDQMVEMIGALIEAEYST